MASESHNLHTSPAPMCPRCGYDLQGQVAAWHPGFREEEPHAAGEGAKCPLTGTCSECGLTMEWADVLGRVRQVTRLFEVDNKQLARAFGWTWLWSLLCWPLWKRLELHHAIRGDRLAAFACMTAIGWYLAVAVPWFVADNAAMFEALVLHGSLSGPPWQMPGSYVRTFEPFVPLGLLVRADWGDPLVKPQWIMPVVLHWMMMPLTFLLLPQSLQRAKVRKAHLVRAGIYAVSWMWFAFHLPFVYMLIGEAVWGWMWQYPGMEFVESQGQVWVLAMVFALVWWSVVTGRYLRLPRPWLVGLVLSVLSVLLTCLIIFVCGGGPTYVMDTI